MMQEGCLDFYKRRGCCFICPEKEQGCWCEDCRCHDCLRYTKLKDTAGGICDILRVETKKVDSKLIIVEGVFKLKFGKNEFLPIGTMREDGFFQTRRNQNQFFYKFDGFALNKEVLEYLEKIYPEKCHGIRIVYHGQGGVVHHYYSTPKDWFEKGTPYKNDIFPYDAQYALDYHKMIDKRLK